MIDYGEIFDIYQGRGMGNLWPLYEGGTVEEKREFAWAKNKEEFEEKAKKVIGKGGRIVFVPNINFFHLDVDTKHVPEPMKSKLISFLDSHSVLSNTLCVESKSGGRHYMFKGSRKDILGHLKGQSALYAFNDYLLESDVGYIDVPWNITTPPTKNYKFINTCIPLTIKSKDIEKILNLKRYEEKKKIMAIDQVTVGTRHNQLLKVIGSFANDGMSKTEIKDEIQQYRDLFIGNDFDFYKEVESITNHCITKQGKAEDMQLFEWNQAGMADRIAHYIPSGEIIYNITSDSWYRYRDGKYWADNVFNPLQRIVELVREILWPEMIVKIKRTLKGIDEDAREKAKKGLMTAASSYYKQCLTEAYTKGVLSYLKDMDGFCATESTDESMGRPVFNQKFNKINFENTSYSLDTFSDTTHDFLDYSTTYCPVNYDPAKDCPKFKSFIAQILNNDPELIHWMKCYLGSCLIGGDNTDKMLAIFWGPKGNNGKSTLIELLLRILGEYAGMLNVEAIAYTKNPDKFGMSHLPNKRLIVAQEPNKNSKLDIQRVKKLTGNDTLVCERKHKPAFNFKPSFKMILVTNEKPHINDDGAPVWERVRLVPFDVSIDKKDQIKNLDKILFDTEASGIINWMIDGAKEWKSNGLPSCKAIDDTSKEYQQEENVVLDWVKDRCEEVDVDKGDMLKTLHDDFKNDRFFMRKSEFKQSLIKLGVKSMVDPQGRVKFGLSLVSENSGFTAFE